MIVLQSVKHAIEHACLKFEKFWIHSICSNFPLGETL